MTRVRNRQHGESFQLVEYTATNTHTCKTALTVVLQQFKIYFGDSLTGTAGSVLGLLGDCQSI